MGKQVMELYQIEVISFDNAADNRGVKAGVWVELDRRREEVVKEHGKEHQPLIAKGCSDYIIALSMKEWEREIARLRKEWQLTSLSPPSDTKHYLNRFTSTMKRISRRFIEGPWRGRFPAFMHELGESPQNAPARVTRVHFVSTDQMACHVYQWYIYYYLFYCVRGRLRTAKDDEDFGALTNQDILHLTQISAIGLEVLLGPFMRSLPKIRTVATYTTCVQGLLARVNTLLDNTNERRTFFRTDHSLHVHRLGVHDLQEKIQRLATHGKRYGEISLATLPTSFLLPFSTQSTYITAPQPHSPAHPLSCYPSSDLSNTPTTTALFTYPTSLDGCPPLPERLDEYELSYLRSVKCTLEKFDAKFMSEGEYTKNDVLQSLVIPTSTRSVERSFSTLDWLCTTRGARLRALLLIARHEAKESRWYLDKYLKKYQVIKEARRLLDESPTHTEIEDRNLKHWLAASHVELERAENRANRNAEDIDIDPSGC